GGAAAAAVPDRKGQGGSNGNGAQAARPAGEGCPPHTANSSDGSAGAGRVPLDDAAHHTECYALSRPPILGMVEAAGHCGASRTLCALQAADTTSAAVLSRRTLGQQSLH